MASKAVSIYFRGSVSCPKDTSACGMGWTETESMTLWLVDAPLYLRSCPLSLGQQQQHFILTHWMSLLTDWLLKHLQS